MAPSLTDTVLNDAQIATLTPEQRRDLMDRLARPVDPRVRARYGRLRPVRLTVMTTLAVGFVPWIILLASVLPVHYVANRWRATWVGFDVVLAALLTLTLACGWQRRQLVVPFAFAAGVLLLCDAWFDVMMSQSDELSSALASALLAELPLGCVMLLGSLRLMRWQAVRSWRLEPRQSLWRLRLSSEIDDERGFDP